MHTKTIESKETFFRNRVTVINGDITNANVDAIVNAANQWLIPGGGVDGAIHRAAGPKLAAAAKLQGFLKTGQAIMTPAFDLKAKFVFHALGPIWEENETESRQSALLIQAYQSVFKLAIIHQCQSIAIPNISTGVYGFPKGLAAKLVTQFIAKWIQESAEPQLIELYCMDEENYELYVKEFKKGSAN